jgi:hypothetical protein
MFNTAGKINHGYSPLKQFCPNVVRLISSFDGDKDDHTILLFCVQNGWAGGHWSSLRNFTVATTTWLTVMEYLCHKCQRICSTCRKHFPVLSSFMTYQRILIKKKSLVKIYYMNERINTVVLGYTPVGSSCIYIAGLSS